MSLEMFAKICYVKSLQTSTRAVDASSCELLATAVGKADSHGRRAAARRRTKTKEERGISIKGGMISTSPSKDFQNNLAPLLTSHCSVNLGPSKWP